MARLIVDSGPDAEMAFTLGTDVTTLGRSGSSTIQLRDGHVSRQHAEIVYRDNAYWARDLHSRNGTFVQGVRLTGERMLSHGDQIRIGHTVLIFSEEQGEPAAAEEKPPETSAVYLANEMIGDVKTSIHRETIFNEEMCGDHVKSLLWAVEKIHAATQPNRILPEIMDIV
ncbi:FHA domain-containing protein, partial [Candidatus Sumerlaeota bacterium]|nr:FHA domain-containing protein [Candidatus Sumerlaeota bacterium]